MPHQTPAACFVQQMGMFGDERRHFSLNRHAKQMLGSRLDHLSRSDARYDQRLSERRASSVAGELIDHGVNRYRLYVAGVGETRPVASNDTDAGRAANRRVEIRTAPHTT